MNLDIFEKFLADTEGLTAKKYLGHYDIRIHNCGPLLVTFIDAAFLSGDITVGEVHFSLEPSDLALDRMGFSAPTSKLTLEHVPRFVKTLGKDVRIEGKDYVAQLLFRWRLQNCV